MSKKAHVGHEEMFSYSTYWLLLLIYEIKMAVGGEAGIGSGITDIYLECIATGKKKKVSWVTKGLCIFCVGCLPILTCLVPQGPQECLLQPD